MAKLHFKGLNHEIEFMYFDERLNKLIPEFEDSFKKELLLPDSSNQFEESVLQTIYDFEKYFFNRTSVVLSQNLSVYKTRIIDYQDKQLSVLKAIEELKEAQRQVKVWRDKINSGRYGEEKTNDRKKNIYYLTKHVFYLKYLNGYSKLIRDVYIFLDTHFREFLITNNVETNIVESNEITGQEFREKDFLSVNEALKYYGIGSRTTLNKYAADPNNPIEKKTVGGKVYFSKVKIFPNND